MQGPNTDPADVPEVQSASTHVKSQPLSTGTGNESMLQAQSGSLNAKIEVTNRKIAAMKVEEEGLKPKTVSEDAQVEILNSTVRTYHTLCNTMHFTMGCIHAMGYYGVR